VNGQFIKLLVAGLNWRLGRKITNAVKSHCITSSESICLRSLTLPQKLCSEIVHSESFPSFHSNYCISCIRSLGVRVVLLVRDPRGTLQSRKHRDWCPGNPDCFEPMRLCTDLVADYSAAVRLSMKYPHRFRYVPTIYFFSLSMQLCASW
jgi:hypothetical protein